MTRAGPLQWRTGSGWLVLVGGGRWEDSETIHSQAISALLDESPIAFVPAANPDPTYGAAFLSYYADLGAPRGYVVPIRDQKSARDPINYRRLVQAGLIFIGGGDASRLIETLEGTPVIDAIAGAFDSGAVIVGVSAGAMILGKWGLSSDTGKILPGWGWVSDSIVVPHYSADRAAQARGALQRYPEALALGLPDNVALALGPDGELETWTDTLQQITVTIGAKFGR